MAVEVEYVKAKTLGALKTDVDVLLASTSPTYALAGFDIDRNIIDGQYIQAMAKTTA